MDRFNIKRLFARFVNLGILDSLKAKRKQAEAPLKQAASSERAQPSGIASISKKRRFGFRVIALILPLVLVAGIEVVLRAVHYGYPTTFFLESNELGTPTLHENPKVGWRFFPANVARAPLVTSIPARKPPGVIRIFVFGESAALGDPEPAYGFPRILSVLLRDRFPNKRFEIVNTGIVAINSHVILPIARECAGLEGNLWIVYMGNNEVVGPYGSGTVFSRQTPPLAFIRANIAFKRLRLGQWLSERMSAGTTTEPMEWGGMGMLSDQKVRHDDPRMRSVYHNFQENLSGVLAAGSRAGVPILLSTVGVNLRECAPFASDHGVGLNSEQETAWSRAFASAQQEDASTNEAAQVEAWQKVVDLDGGYAGSHFELGEAWMRQGRTDKAATEFSLARDLDALRFRADSRINDLIAQEGAQWIQRGVTLVDTAGRLARKAKGGIPGGDFFYEHVHFNFHGNYEVALGLAGAATKALGLASGPADDSGWSSEETCASRLAWTGFDQLTVWQGMRRRMGEAPFTNQLNHAAQMAAIDAEIKPLLSAEAPSALDRATQEYREALKRNPEDWMLHARLGKLLLELHDIPGALVECGKEAELTPHNPAAHYELGNLLDQSGEPAKAEAEFLRALELRPDMAEACNGLGLIKARQRDYVGAQDWYRRAQTLRPSSTEAYVNLGQALAAQGRDDEAIQQYEEAIRRQPHDAAAYINLGKIYRSRHDVDRALGYYEKAVEFSPASAPAHYNLANALTALGRRDEAAGQYQQAVEFGPALPEARLSLGVSLAQRGQQSLAIEQFKEALRLRPDMSEARFNLGAAYAELRMNAEALIEFQEILKSQPDSVDAQVNLGLLLLQMHRSTDAIGHLERAVKLAPQNEMAAKLLARARAVPHRPE